MNGRSDPADLAREFVELNQYLSSGGERGAALQRLVDSAVIAVPGCRWAAVTVWRERRQPRTLPSPPRSPGRSIRSSTTSATAPA